MGQFTKNELFALSSAIKSAHGEELEDLVSLNKKCLAINAGNVSNSGLARLIEAKDIIAKADNGIEAIDLANKLSVSLATIYRMADKIKVLDARIIVKNRYFHYEGRIDERLLKPKIKSRVSSADKAKLIKIINDNPSGIHVSDVALQMGLTYGFVVSFVSALDDKKIKRANGYFYIDGCEGDYVKTKYILAGEYINKVGAPVEVDLLLKLFKWSASYRYVKKLGFVRIKGYVGKKEWFSADSIANK